MKEEKLKVILSELSMAHVNKAGHLIRMSQTGHKLPSNKELADFTTDSVNNAIKKIKKIYNLDED